MINNQHLKIFKCEDGISLSEFKKIISDPLLNLLSQPVKLVKKKNKSLSTNTLKLKPKEKKENHPWYEVFKYTSSPSLIMPVHQDVTLLPIENDWLIKAVGKMLNDKWFTIENPGDLGVFWNAIVQGDPIAVKTIFQLGLMRKFMSSANSGVVTSLSDATTTSDETYNTDNLQLLDFGKPSIYDKIINASTFEHQHPRSAIKENRTVQAGSTNVRDYKFKVRNRGDMTPVQTPGGIITSLYPWVNSNDVNEFYPNHKDVFMEVTEDGIFKISLKNQLKDNSMIAPTYATKVTKFIKDDDGNFEKIADYKSPRSTYYVPVTEYYNRNDKLTRGKQLAIWFEASDPQAKKYGYMVGGRALVKVGNELRLIEGSLHDIDSEFEDMKKRNNTNYGTFYLIDNGSYAIGMRTNSGYVNSSDWKYYDLQGGGGGGYVAYILPDLQNLFTPDSDASLEKNSLIYNIFKQFKEGEFLEQQLSELPNNVLILNATQNAYKKGFDLIENNKYQFTEKELSQFENGQLGLRLNKWR